MLLVKGKSVLQGIVFTITENERCFAIGMNMKKNLGKMSLKGNIPT